MMEHLSKVIRMFVIKRSLFLWILIGLVCTMFLFYRAEDRISKSTDHNLDPLLNSGDSNQNTDEENSIEYQAYYAQTQSTRVPEVIPSPYELNNTNKAIQETLFFNRVPKVGSQTFMELMKQLAYINVVFFLIAFYTKASESIRINRNAFKPPVSEYVKDIVRRNFSREVEFYEFCKDRLYKQYRALRLPSKSIDVSSFN